MRHRDFDGKARPFAGYGTNGDAVAEQAPQSLDDCKTEADAAGVRALRNLIMLLEYVNDVLARNSDSAVPDFNPHLVIGATAADQHFASIGVAYCIRNQIADHFFQHLLVATHHEPGSNDAQVQAFFFGDLGKIRRYGVEQGVHRPLFASESMRSTRSMSGFRLCANSCS